MEACCLINPYLYGFSMMMPLFFDRNIVNLDSWVSDKIMPRAACKNLLRDVMQSLEYRLTLRPARINHGMILTPGSRLMFVGARYGIKRVVDMDNQDIEHLFEESTAQYLDKFGKFHNISLIRLVVNSMYFWSIFRYDQALSKGKTLCFDPKSIVKKTKCNDWFIPAKPSDWSYEHYEQFCDLYLTSDALEAVLLYINYGQVNYGGSLRAYVAACYYLQSDSALLYLMECKRINHENYVAITKSVLNNFGPEHPVLDFLLIYGTSNLYWMVYSDIINMFVSPNSVCHMMCESKNRAKYRETNSKCQHELPYNSTCSLCYNLSSTCAVPPKNRKITEFDTFYCEGLQAILNHHVQQLKISTHYNLTNCVICNSLSMHCPKTSNDKGATWKNCDGFCPEVFSANLLCCDSMVHRTCFHERFNHSTIYFCPICNQKFVNTWAELKTERVQNGSNWDVYIRYGCPYDIGFYDQKFLNELEFRVKVFSNCSFDLSFLNTSEQI